MLTGKFDVLTGPPSDMVLESEAESKPVNNTSIFLYWNNHFIKEKKKLCPDAGIGKLVPRIPGELKTSAEQGQPVRARHSR